MTIAAFRTGSKVHTGRPRSNERAARLAWDELSEHGDLKDLLLLDGLWMAELASGEIVDIEASIIRFEIDQPNPWEPK